MVVDAGTSKPSDHDRDHGLGDHGGVMIGQALSRTQRRCFAIHAKVRSTIQQRGSTLKKVDWPAGLRTISTATRKTVVAQGGQLAGVASVMRVAYRGIRLVWARDSNGRAASRSWTLAAVTNTTSSPRVSIAR